MSLDDLSDTERGAIEAAMRYWLARWDWEFPTLFGLERRELENVLKSWPRSVVSDERAAALAMTSSLRELLHGASAVRKSQVQDVCGLSYDEANLLSKRIWERFGHAI
jgi:hypothetical protein